MKFLTWLAVTLAVALGMSSGKDEVPGPAAEDGPPAEGPVEEVDPAPEDQQEIQGRVALEAAKGGHYCPGFSHDGRCYRIFRGPKGARDAEVFCEKLSAGGHLASITSQHLHREVKRQILRSIGAPTHVWVGGLRYSTGRRFVWRDGSSWSYADWSPGKPRPTSTVDNCVELLANGKFNDLRCSVTQAFICSHPK